jgi:hypothetical protein
VIGVAAVVLGEIYHASPVWFFFAWNSIFFIPLIGRDFRGQFKAPQFRGVFGIWVALHGTMVVLLIKWIRMLYWAPLIAIELFLGYLIVSWLFGILPDREQ